VCKIEEQNVGWDKFGTYDVKGLNLLQVVRETVMYYLFLLLSFHISNFYLPSRAYQGLKRLGVELSLQRKLHQNTLV